MHTLYPKARARACARSMAHSVHGWQSPWRQWASRRVRPMCGPGPPVARRGRHLCMRAVCGVCARRAHLSGRAARSGPLSQSGCTQWFLGRVRKRRRALSACAPTPYLDSPFATQHQRPLIGDGHDPRPVFAARPIILQVHRFGIPTIFRMPSATRDIVAASSWRGRLHISLVSLPFSSPSRCRSALV